MIEFDVGKQNALYREKRGNSKVLDIQVEQGRVSIITANGEWRSMSLDVYHCETRDASCGGRFVKQLLIGGKVNESFITPPEEGAIAPRASGLPAVELPSCSVLASDTWQCLANWLIGGATLAGRTTEDLAMIATIASPQFAIIIGEQVAMATLALAVDVCSPMRRSFQKQWGLSPLRQRAKKSERARDALLAALSIVQCD